jgi:hypothetical protein
MKNPATAKSGRAGRHSHHGTRWIETAFAAVLCVLTLLAAQPAWAYPDEHALREQRMAEVKARLKLTDDQLGQVRPVLEDAAEAQRSVLLKYGIDLESEGGPKPKLGMREGRKLRGDLQKVQSDTQKRLEGILTKQQLEEFKKLQQERSEEMRKRIRG